MTSTSSVNTHEREITGSGRWREVAGPVSGCCLAWGDGRSIAGMSDSIFLLGDDGSVAEAHSTAYQAEAELQVLLADHVHLLPRGADQPGQAAPLAAHQARGGGAQPGRRRLVVGRPS